MLVFVTICHILTSRLAFCPPMIQNIAIIWYIIELAITNALRQFIPFSKFYSHQQPPWFSSEIRHHINHLNTLHCRLKNHPSKSIEDKLKHLTNEALLKEKSVTVKPTIYELIYLLYQTVIRFTNIYIKTIAKSKTFHL